MADKSTKSSRQPLTNDARLEVTRELQNFMLTEIARRADAEGIDAGLVFHGGTSLSIIHGTKRSSEDLDFMGSPDAVTRIFAHSVQIEAAMRMRASLEWPGARIDLVRKAQGREPELGDVVRMMLRWEHPGHYGAIRVKVEFYLTPQDRLDRYLSQRQAIAGDVSRGLIRAALPVSIWGDKIVAMAQRPALKHRDIHDLGVLSRMVPAQADRKAALLASMGIYGRAPHEIRDGLQRDFVLAGDTDFEGFSEDMSRWFGAEHVLRIRANGDLERLFEAFLDQAALGRALVADLAPDVEVRHEDEVDGCGM
ncbi:nucleotidyl transferase AbiEii/AbiGii toxin family protein [Paracoccus sp. ME4]|uniref:nucleotidyl transferase AbiEii/AbiGii toxin family protein n=1 Tax=Paracoccus sp. ME4 TaxID=3138066 RepID=UPI00398A5441